MEQIATLPPVIALQLVEELHAAGIPAETTDMAPGVAAAVYPGLLEATLTVWVRDPKDAVRARAVLERMQASFEEEDPEAVLDEGDPCGEDADPVRPDATQRSRRRRIAHFAVLMLWFGPLAIIILLGVLLALSLAVGGVG